MRRAESSPLWLKLALMREVPLRQKCPCADTAKGTACGSVLTRSGAWLTGWRRFGIGPLEG